MKSRTPIMCFSYLIVSCQLFTAIYAQGLLGRFQDFAAIHTPDIPSTGGSDPAFPPDNTFPSDDPFPADNTFPADDIFPPDPQSPTSGNIQSTSSPTSRPLQNSDILVSNNIASNLNDPPIQSQNPANVINTANERLESTTVTSVVQTNPTTISTNPTRNTNVFLPNIPFGGRVIDLVNGITNSFNPGAIWIQSDNQEPANSASNMAAVDNTTPRPTEPIVPVVLFPAVPDSGIRTNFGNGSPTSRPIVPSVTQQPRTTTTEATTTTRMTTTTMRPTTTSATTVTTPGSTTRREPGGIVLGSAINVPVNLRPVGSPRSPFGSAWRPVFVTSSASPITENIPEQSLGDTRPGLGFGRGSETYRLLTELSLNSFGRNRDLARKLRAMSRGNRRNNRGRGRG